MPTPQAAPDPAPVRITGHRGAMGVEPENTLRSFRRAVADGCDEVELDLRRTRDGHLVLVHDADLLRTTGTPGKVAELTLADIRALDPDPETRVPTFAEAVAVIPVPIQAELKDPAAVEPLARVLDAEPALAARTLVISFKPDRLLEIRRLRPGTPVGLITHRATETAAELVAAARAAEAETVVCGLPGLTAAHVDACHAAGLRITTWSVNEVPELRRVLAMGVDGVTTDHPGELAAALRSPV
ncbi:glycerophosphodiester phosphodiesterase [Allonocardiopsis opalescens]|uniref:Glycerophosphoryl diester phosphodiesterase n=1 Tax=Allonocardiopsis opalescens TaxID=1144618 RepID=A0A2T0PZ30_9ACTN|nr:glycerophosphodiester phosphodiesterase family protein [Allonocardiopsis opalescens]PRX96781.1 glycerophosphoryl diester phosphodiesterase [Allonocardiopsis opalescens]